MYKIMYRFRGGVSKNTPIASMPGMAQLKEIVTSICSFPDLEELVIHDLDSAKDLYVMQNHNHTDGLPICPERIASSENLLIAKLRQSVCAGLYEPQASETFRNCHMQCKIFLYEILEIDEFLVNLNISELVELAVQYLYDAKIRGGVQFADTADYVDAFKNAVIYFCEKVNLVLR